MFDALIVSAFGRGNWMARELSSMGHKVGLLDLSSQMGPWAPEDWEGPFGLFQSDRITPSQWARITHEDYQDEVTDGLTIWAEGGPLDMRGPLKSFWSQKNRAYAALEAAVISGKWPKEFANDFSQAWMVHLAAQLASSRFLMNGEALGTRPPDSASLNQMLPLFAPYFIRRASRRGLTKGLDYVKERGVEVFETKEIVDLLLERKLFAGLEVRSEWSGLLKSKALIWFLSSEETKWRTPKVFDRLCPDGALTAEWSWLRYRVQFDLDTSAQYLPIQFVLIEDRAAPWTHANLLVCQQTSTGKALDVWLRVPTHFRFQRDYLDQMGAQTLKLLSRKIKRSQFFITDMPQDYLYDGEVLGPSLYPQFHVEAQFAPTKSRNIFWAGVEEQSLLDWSGACEKDRMVMSRVVDFIQKQQINQTSKTKESEIDPSLHAP